MTNIAFTASIAARIAFEQNKTDDVMCAANIKSLQTAERVISNETIVALLSASEVSCDTFAASNVYTINKIVDFLQFARKAKADMNDMNKYVLLTALNFALAEIDMTADDARDACSKHRKVSADKRKLVVQNNEVKADSTVQAQHASSLAALVYLKVLSYSNKVYRMNFDSAFTVELLSRI